MPINEIALVGLACVLANSPATSKNQLRAKLSDPEKVYVQEIVDSKACHSEAIKNLIEKTMAEFKPGVSSVAQPCTATTSDR